MTRKTSKTKIAIASILIAGLLVGSTPIFNSASALPAYVEDNKVGENEIAITERSDKEVRDYSEVNEELPTPHTKAQLEDFETKALQDQRALSLLGDNYVYKSSGKYGSDEDQKSQISFFTDDQGSVVTIGFEKGEIVTIDKYETEMGYSRICN